MSGKVAFGFRIDRRDPGREEQGDCESCRFFLADQRTCLVWLAETASYESCAEWKEQK